MLEYIKYLLFCLRYPQAKDFINEGFGISARARRTNPYWKPHLTNSREFILQAVKESPEKPSIAILGAGTLLDIPFDELLPFAKSITLVDANPGALPALRAAKARGEKLSVPVEILLLEVTGRFASWTKYLKQNKAHSKNKAGQETLAQHLAHMPQSNVPLQKYDIVVSANLLSQIGVMWRDRASTVTGQLEENLQALLSANCRLLEIEHLQMLSQISKNKIVLLSDRTFMFYKKDVAAFQCENALLLEDIPSAVMGFHLHRQESWFWHVAPQDTEQLGYGVIHDVFAQNFHKNI